jgi:hypothetical protein
VPVESRFGIAERSLFLLAVTGEKTAYFYAVQLLINAEVGAIAVLDGLRYILLHVSPVAPSVHISISLVSWLKYTRMKGKWGWTEDGRLRTGDWRLMTNDCVRVQCPFDLTYLLGGDRLPRNDFI